MSTIIILNMVSYDGTFPCVDHQIRSNSSNVQSQPKEVQGRDSQGKNITRKAKCSP